ncbi:RTA1-like protein 5 [Elsinoe fawcettii]|nr:RTA1-like protein 5 [Elsinoe fawcettii]
MSLPQPPASNPEGDRYDYKPSLAAAIIFVVLFSFSTVVHGVQIVRARCWFMIWFAIGGLFEIVGYTGRSISATEDFNNYTFAPYVIQALLTLLAPAFFAASIYMSLGRIILMVEADHLALIRTRWLTRLFVTGDVLSFVVQALADSKSESDRANKIVIIGLIIQVLFFGLFMLTALRLQQRLRREPTGKSLELHNVWRKHLFALYGTSGLVMLRSIFRLIEYAQGQDGYLLSVEWPLYVFDAVPMVLVMVVLNFIHGSELNAWVKGGKFTAKLGFELKNVA